MKRSLRILAVLLCGLVMGTTLYVLGGCAGPTNQAPDKSISTIIEEAFNELYENELGGLETTLNFTQSTICGHVKIEQGTGHSKTTYNLATWPTDSDGNPLAIFYEDWMDFISNADGYLSAKGFTLSIEHTKISRVFKGTDPNQESIQINVFGRENMQLYAGRIEGALLCFWQENLHLVEEEFGYPPHSLDGGAKLCGGDTIDGDPVRTYNEKLQEICVFPENENVPPAVYTYAVDLLEEKGLDYYGPLGYTDVTRLEDGKVAFANNHTPFRKQLVIDFTPHM